MGIRYLNRFLKLNCQQNIHKIHLSNLRGRSITIDTSIYLYRFMGEGNLIEGFYSLISIFNRYEIKPLFIFDGKSPQQKNFTIEKRQEERRIAEEKYKSLTKNIKELTEQEDISEAQSELDVLRRKIIRVTRKDIDEVKKLIELMGGVYIDAEGEADELCVKLVMKKIAYACLSEDMDMFVYGCSRVLRYLSLLNETVVMYDYMGILKTLNITKEEFMQITVLGGTDYNAENRRPCSLNQALRLFGKYKKGTKNTTESNKGFYEWLESTKQLDDYCQLVSTLLLFQLDNISIPTNCKQYISQARRAPYNELTGFLRNYGFIFV